MLVVPGMGVVMSGLPGVRDVLLPMHVMVVLRRAMVIHVDTSHASCAVG
jgi:hypothetical protein